jgi:hypothetical protein
VSGGSVRRLFVLSGISERSIRSALGEKSRSVLFAWWTRGLVGGLRMKLEGKEDPNEGALDLATPVSSFGAGSREAV